MKKKMFRAMAVTAIAVAVAMAAYDVGKNNPTNGSEDNSNSGENNSSNSGENNGNGGNGDDKNEPRSDVYVAGRVRNAQGNPLFGLGCASVAV